MRAKLADSVVSCALAPMMLSAVNLSQRPVLLEKFGSSIDVGYLSSNLATIDLVFIFLGAPIANIYGSKWGSNNVAIVGALLMSTAMFCYSNANSVQSLIAVRIVLALGAAASLSTSTNLLRQFCDAVADNPTSENSDESNIGIDFETSKDSGAEGINEKLRSAIGPVSCMCVSLGSAIASAMVCHALSNTEYMKMRLEYLFLVLGGVCASHAFTLCFKRGSQEYVSEKPVDYSDKSNMTYAGDFISRGFVYFITFYGPLTMVELYSKADKCDASGCRNGVFGAAAAVGLANGLGAITAIAFNRRRPLSQHQLSRVLRWSLLILGHGFIPYSLGPIWKPAVILPFFEVGSMVFAIGSAGVATGILGLAVSPSTYKVQLRKFVMIMAAVAAIVLTQTYHKLSPDLLMIPFAAWCLFTEILAIVVIHRSNKLAQLAKKQDNSGEDTHDQIHRLPKRQVFGTMFALMSLGLPSLVASLVQPGLLVMATVGAGFYVLPSATLLYQDFKE